MCVDTNRTHYSNYKRDILTDRRRYFKGNILRWTIATFFFISLVFGAHNLFSFNTQRFYIVSLNVL